jgi:hypothetical protein
MYVILENLYIYKKLNICKINEINNKNLSMLTILSTSYIGIFLDSNLLIKFILLIIVDSNENKLS